METMNGGKITFEKLKLFIMHLKINFKQQKCTGFYCNYRANTGLVYKIATSPPHKHTKANVPTINYKLNMTNTNMWTFKMPVLRFLCSIFLDLFVKRQMWWRLIILCLQETKGSLCEAGTALPLLLCTQSVHVTFPPWLWHLNVTTSG